MRTGHRPLRMAVLGIVVTFSLVSPTDTHGQNLSGDARDVGLGGVDYASRILSDSSRNASGFVVPLGLLQLLANRKSIQPGSAAFDPALALEYSAVPMHYVFGRQPSAARARFISDIRQAGLSDDLNSYRGFRPAATLQGAGILSPTVGKNVTLKSWPRLKNAFFGGVGPYLTLRTAALFDQRLVSMLGASSTTYVPSSSLEIGNTTAAQGALQITGGYRGELTLRQSSGGRLLFDLDYNHLEGFRYENADINLRLDTNGGGLLQFNPARGAPLAIQRFTSSRGRGRSVDVGVAAIFDKWRIAARADGIGNHIDWKRLTRREYEMTRLTGNASRLALASSRDAGDARVTLPVEFRLQGAYQGTAWGSIAEWERGVQGNSASAGLERRFQRIELRGGARFLNRIVLPSAGVSLRAGRMWFDVGAALSTANIERDRNVVLATSIRFALDQMGSMGLRPAQ